jgi:N-acetylglucosamine-6-sulfatase
MQCGIISHTVTRSESPADPVRMIGFSRRLWGAACCVVVIGVLLAWLVGGQPAPAGAGRATKTTAPSTTATTTVVDRPNIVFVLTDDLSWNLVRFLPQVRALQKEGMTFTDYVVTDSLCCPSRASILTGRFPHNTGVFTNNGSDGGFTAFHGKGQESDTFATGLRARGYRTALMGKYLNGYQPTREVGGAAPYVPPGWSTWNVAGGGYGGYWYNLAEGRTVERHGHRPADYVTDVLAGKGEAFIKRSARAGVPFMLEVAPFAPHAPYTPAPRHANAFPGLTAPRGPAYDRLPTDAPPWLAGATRMSTSMRTAIDGAFRKRAQAVQAVDDLIGRLRAALTAAGVADDTYVVFSSDNGYHMGEHQLTPGKSTAFDTDIRVPLVVAGPGVPAGSTSDAAAANIDLAPTFLDAADAPVSTTVDGRSLLPLLYGGSDDKWRTANLIEHHGPNISPDDPDRPRPGGGNPPSYAALRTQAYTYVEYVDGSREYYDRIRDPHQLHNLAGSLRPARLRQLHAALTRLTHCQDGPTCWAAGHI